MQETHSDMNTIRLATIDHDERIEMETVVLIIRHVMQ